MTTEEIYLFLMKHLTAENLQETSLRIIDAYKKHDTALLQSYAEQLHIQAGANHERKNSLFLKLIKYFHPDRLSFFQMDVERCFKAGQHERLAFYKNLLTAKQGVENRLAGRFEYSKEEEYHFNDQDFGYSVHGSENSDEDAFINEVEVEMDFLHALKSAYMGNLDLHIDHAELESIEGDLTLCDYGISDLEGLQYCRHIGSLNLSYNRISSVYELKHLTDLRELFLNSNCISNIEYLENLSCLEIADLSNNEIENGSALLRLDSLRFLDIRNNPLDLQTIAPLFEKKEISLIM